MELSAVAEIFTFAVFGFIAFAGALGMTTTMSMYRSAIFLMASFIGVGGLFVLMMADLLGLLQVMMYIGGMLVMALFMVLFSGDPGGEMMTGMMELPPVEKFFSLGLAHGVEAMDHGGDEDGGDDHGGHEGDRHDHDHDDHGGHEHEDGGHEHEDGGHEHEDGGHEHEDGRHGHDGGGHGDREHEEGGHDMDMEPMFVMENKKPAAVMAGAVWALLSGLILFRPAWPVDPVLPAQNSAEQIGDLLMSKYMVAFEGAGLLILLGIFGAVYLSRPGRYPDPTGRDEIQAAVDETPAGIVEDDLEPWHPVGPPGERGTARGIPKPADHS